MALTKIDDRGLKTPIDLLDNEKIRFGTGNDLEVQHTSGNSRITHGGTGNLIIETTATDSDLYLRGKDKVVIQPADGDDGVICNANGSVELYYDNSRKLETFNSGVQFDDNIVIKDSKKAFFGDGYDLQIYHDGSHNYIKSSNGNIYVDVPESTKFELSHGAETLFSAYADGRVDLYYDNSKRFETASEGAIVTGSSVNHGLRVNTAMTSYGVVIVRDPNDSNTACFQAENGTQGASQVNLVLRSVDLGSNNWAGARYNAEYHQFNHQTNSKVRIDSDGLKFGNDTAAANALDDYEEGTWTPGTVTGTWNTASGYYTKIGRLVQATAYLYGCTNTTASDEVRVNGLPFTPSLTTTAGVNMPESSTGFHIAIVNSSNYVTIATPDGAATIHTMEHGDISTGGNTGRLHLHITYQMST